MTNAAGEFGPVQPMGEINRLLIIGSRSAVDQEVAILLPRRQRRKAEICTGVRDRKKQNN